MTNQSFAWTWVCFLRVDFCVLMIIVIATMDLKGSFRSRSYQLQQSLLLTPEIHFCCFLLSSVFVFVGEFCRIGERMHGFNSVGFTANLAPRSHEQILFWTSTLPEGLVAHFQDFCLLHALSLLGKVCFILPRGNS